MKAILLITSTFILVLLLNSIAIAQGLPPMLPDAPSQAPIDGGLGLLAAAGGAYAFKKLKDRKNIQEENIDV